MQYEKNPSVSIYLDVYRAVGRDYIWNYRPGQSHEEIEKIIRSSNTWLYYIFRKDEIVGLAEFDATQSGEVELVHFGLIPELLHKGIGRKVLNNLLHIIWSSDVKRVWLSTCGLDHPKAISFYERAGFKIFKTRMGEFADYRFSDFYTLRDAPQIPYGTKR